MNESRPLLSILPSQFPYDKRTKINNKNEKSRT